MLKSQMFYFEDSESELEFNSDSELEFILNPQAYSSKKTPGTTREVLALPLPSPGGPGDRGPTPRERSESPPLVLAFPLPSPGGPAGDRGPTPRERSPPLVLAFPFSGGHDDRGLSPSSDVDSIPGEEPGLDSADEAVEDWMVLGGAPQEGDEDIQINLGYWRGSSSEESDGRHISLSH